MAEFHRSHAGGFSDQCALWYIDGASCGTARIFYPVGKYAWGREQHVENPWLCVWYDADSDRVLCGCGISSPFAFSFFREAAVEVSDFIYLKASFYSVYLSARMVFGYQHHNAVPGMSALCALRVYADLLHGVGAAVEKIRGKR